MVVLVTASVPPGCTWRSWVMVAPSTRQGWPLGTIKLRAVPLKAPLQRTSFGQLDTDTVVDMVSGIPTTTAPTSTSNLRI